MKNKIKVSSSQFNYQYGDQIHFPYSIARLVSFLKTNEKFVDKLEFSTTGDINSRRTVFSGGWRLI